MSKVDRTVKRIRALSDEDARAVERAAIVETTGDHAKDPSEEVTTDERA